MSFNTKELIDHAISAAKDPTAIKLTFENLNYEVEADYTLDEQKKYGKKTFRKEIVKNVSGYALPGQTLFIMGASGAGKTSLLNILSDRIAVKASDKLTGKKIINDTVVCD